MRILRVAQAKQQRGPVRGQARQANALQSSRPTSSAPTRAPRCILKRIAITPSGTPPSWCRPFAAYAECGLGTHDTVISWWNKLSKERFRTWRGAGRCGTRHSLVEWCQHFVSFDTHDELRWLNCIHGSMTALSRGLAHFALSPKDEDAIRHFCTQVADAGIAPEASVALCLDTVFFFNSFFLTRPE